jgi:hypothetical protein
MDDGFRVAMRSVTMASRNQLFAQSRMIVNLTVEYNPNGAVFIANGLMTSGDVDNTQAPHTDSNAALGVHALVVGAAVDHRGAHSPEDAFIHPHVPISFDYTSNSAHAVFS